MKVRNPGIHLQLVRSESARHKAERSGQEAILSWEKRVISSEKGSGVKRGILSAQSRAARVEELRRQVSAGTYLVNNQELAEKMLGLPRQFELNNTIDP